MYLIIVNNDMLILLNVIKLMYNFCSALYEAWYFKIHPNIVTCLWCIYFGVSWLVEASHARKFILRVTSFIIIFFFLQNLIMKFILKCLNKWNDATKACGPQ